MIGRKIGLLRWNHKDSVKLYDMLIKPACASVGIPSYFFPFSDQSKAHKQLLQKFHFKKKKRKRVIKTLGALYKYDNFFKKN